MLYLQIIKSFKNSIPDKFLNIFCSFLECYLLVQQIEDYSRGKFDIAVIYLSFKNIKQIQFPKITYVFMSCLKYKENVALN